MVGKRLAANLFGDGPVDRELPAGMFGREPLYDLEDHGGLLGAKGGDHLGKLVLVERGEEALKHLADHRIGAPTAAG